MTLFGKPITVQRRGEGGYSATTGEYAPAGITTYNILATIQPTKSKDTMLLPEGRRTTGGVTVYCKQRLQMPTSAGAQGDVVLVDGVGYEVLAEERWQNSLIPHFTYHCARVVL